MNFAIHHADRIGKLVTIGGIGTNIFSPGPSEGIRCYRVHRGPDPPAPRRLAQLHGLQPATRHGRTHRGALEARDRSGDAGFRAPDVRKAAFAQMMSMMKTSDVPMPWSQMHKVTAPTLLTWGRDDRVSPLDMALLPMRTIPNAELHVFPNCGHWAMIEAKTCSRAMVLAFLTRAPLKLLASTSGCSPRLRAA